MSTRQVTHRSVKRVSPIMLVLFLLTGIILVLLVLLSRSEQKNTQQNPELVTSHSQLPRAAVNQLREKEALETQVRTFCKNCASGVKYELVHDYAPAAGGALVPITLVYAKTKDGSCSLEFQFIERTIVQVDRMDYFLLIYTSGKKESPGNVSKRDGTVTISNACQAGFGWTTYDPRQPLPEFQTH